jgi:hypothetical protein
MSERDTHTTLKSKQSLPYNSSRKAQDGTVPAGVHPALNASGLFPTGRLGYILLTSTYFTIMSNFKIIDIFLRLKDLEFLAMYREGESSGNLLRLLP